MKILPETRGVLELARMARNGELVVPDFQRSFVWDTSSIQDLLVSILSNYYIGSLLFLRVIDPEKPMFAFHRVEGSTDKDLQQPLFMILDGQQRITAIHYALFPLDGLAPRGRQTPVRFILDVKALSSGDVDGAVISLKASDAEKYAEKEAQFSTLRLPFTEIPYLDRWIEEFNDFSSNKSNKEELRSIVRYSRDLLQRRVITKDEMEVPVQQLAAETTVYDVCSIFEKINSTGRALTAFELVHARLFRDGINLVEDWERCVNSLPIVRTHLSAKLPEVLLKVVCLMGGMECRRQNLIKLDPTTVRKHWPRATKYLERALRRLVAPVPGGYGAIQPKWIPYSTMLTPLTYVLDSIDRVGANNSAAFELLHKWYWRTVFSERYAEGTDAAIYQDVRDLEKQVISLSKTKSDPVPEPRFLESSLGDLHLHGHDSPSSAVYRGVLGLLSLNGAQDFFLNDSITLNQLHDHHIFPQAFLRERGISGKQANCIVNRTLIAGRTNQLISDKSPSAYISQMVDAVGSERKVLEILETHFINETAYKAMKDDDYDRFLHARGETLRVECERRSGVLSSKTEVPFDRAPATSPRATSMHEEEGESVSGREDVIDQVVGQEGAFKISNLPAVARRRVVKRYSGSRRLTVSMENQLAVREEKAFTKEDVKKILAHTQLMNSELSSQLHAICSICRSHALYHTEAIHLRCGDLRDGKLYFTKFNIFPPARGSVDVKPEIERLLKDHVGNRGPSEWLFPGRTIRCKKKLVGEGESVERRKNGHVSGRAIQRLFRICLEDLGLHVPGRGVDSLRIYNLRIEPLQE